MSRQGYLRVPQRSRRPSSVSSGFSLSQSSTQQDDRGLRKTPQSKAERLQRNAQTTWQPFFLSRTALCSFLLLFLSIIAALETLQFLSDRNHGIATSSSGKHYLWTYGPTACM